MRRSEPSVSSTALLRGVAPPATEEGQPRCTFSLQDYADARVRHWKNHLQLFWMGEDCSGQEKKSQRDKKLKQKKTVLWQSGHLKFLKNFLFFLKKTFANHAAVSGVLL